MNIIRALLYLLCIAGLPSGAAALEAKGTAVIEYSGRLDKDEKRRAVEAALQNSVERWISTANQSQYRNYEKMKDAINADIDNYVLDYRVLDEEVDKKMKELRVTVRANLNGPRLESTLLSASDAGANDGQSYITFIFVAREQVSAAKQSSKQSEIARSQTQTIDKTSSDTSATMTKSQTQGIDKTDREVQYATEIKYDVSSTNEINVAMGNVFTNANYLVIDADLLEEETGYLLEVANFVRDYQYGDDISGSTRRDAIQGLKSLDDPIQYLAIGTLDVDMEGTDSQTGNIQVPVSVTAQVLAIMKRGAAVAKVGPVQYKGEGSTPTMARNNALKLAAQDVASQLVAMLSSKMIR